MCGIIGLAGGVRPELVPPLLARMSDQVAHRGPDHSGVWTDPGSPVALGHRRLAIIDLAPTGDQPMVSPSGRFVIVFNGEIYDHQEHRADLHERGSRLRGTSDTEVLLTLIESIGVESALTAVDGAFALAVWDREREELTLARDRIGEKPLYYGKIGGFFAFASELTAFSVLPDAPNRPDPGALAGYLQRGFVAGTTSILPGINKVPPGSTVRWTHRAGWGQPEAYWRLVDVAQSGVDQPLEHPGEALHELESLLAQSVRRRLIADVPLGAFLSGGIDSTTIVAIGQSVSERPLHTFTVSVGGASDEAEHAAQIARHLGTNHETLPLPELSPLDLAQTAIDIHDEPFADPSSMPMAVVCAAARKRVKVCLSGDGGDELFAGYNRHRVAVGTLAKVLALPGLPRRAFAAGLSALRPGTWNAIATVLGQPTLDMGTKAHKLATALRADSVSGAYESLAAQWDPSAVLVDPVPSAPTRVPHLLTESDLEQILLQEQTGLLPDDMLVKGDRASMSAGLELRLPLLEHRIVELSWRLPPQAKFRNGRGKWPLRWILEQHVPPSLWDRPKTGFDPPLADWLRGPLREWAHDLLSPNELSSHGLLRPEPISEMLTAHMSGRRNYDYQLWTILMLQGWLDKQNRNSQGVICDGV